MRIWPRKRKDGERMASPEVPKLDDGGEQPKAHVVGETGPEIIVRRTGSMKSSIRRPSEHKSIDQRTWDPLHR